MAAFVDETTVGGTTKRGVGTSAITLVDAGEY